MASLVWPFKDPSETLPNDIDWSLRLGTDSIVSSTWAVVTTDGGNLQIVSDSFAGQRTQVFTSGGNRQFNYELENTITTALGAIEVQTVMLPIRNRS